MAKHKGTPVTIRFHKPRNAWHFHYNDDGEGGEYGEVMQLQDEKDDVVALAELFVPYSYKFHRYTINNIPWTALNNNTDLWGYRIREATKQEVKDSGIFDDDEARDMSYSDSDAYKDIRRWIVDIEINVKRWVLILLNITVTNDFG